MEHFWFICLEENIHEGEQFLVGAYSLDEAHDIATKYFGDVQWMGIMDEIEAEESGLDEY